MAKKSQREKTKRDRKRVHQMAGKQRLTVGLDLGDRNSHYCILDEAGEVVSESSLSTTQTGLSSLFAKMAASRVALEVGTHSPWVSRHISGLGHEVIVANAHKVKLITQSVKKNDRMDARQLARLARVDPQLLSPIQHRGPEAQADLGVIRARAELMEVRTSLINSVRGLVKPMGERLKKCDADQVGEDLGQTLSETAQRVIGPLLKSVETISEQIGIYDQLIEEIAQRYPAVELLTQVYGVGTLIALTFMLTIEDAERFQSSRDVGAFLGLRPKQRDSGASQPELGITKTGDRLVRSLLVQGAHCILRKGAPDSDLRAWGLSKVGTGKRSKRRAIVGVARKLAVLLHRLWVTGEVYDPLYNRKQAPRAAA
ncbi:MAG: IS110 family transposase [Acidobacteria bacterium]|nr:IS110 family transposase [Acidobacteriota bacterium]MBI3488671.1 IS110 family transposase [Acidobacteriota bacterium]